MNLKYPIPHRITARIVGTQFVAACSCKQWTQAADLRRYDRMPGAWYPEGVLPSPVEELLAASTRHATDHVIEQHGFTRKAAS